jgi:hypothetical protein
MFAYFFYISKIIWVGEKKRKWKVVFEKKEIKKEKNGE